MKIVQVNNYTFPARDSQGTQRIIEALSRQFVKEGHINQLLINQDSVVPKEYGTLVSSICDDVDIIHVHGGFPNEYGLSVGNKKWVSTAHGGANDSPEGMKRVWPHVPNLIFISKYCADMYNSSCFVHNCLEPNDFTFSDKKDNYFLWIAGTDWAEDKGLFTSIMLAKKLGFRLKIAGSGKNKNIIDQIKSHCNNKIEYVGSVNGKEKADLLSKARAVLNLGWIKDAFCLTNIEALISGTPVIARNWAAHPEVLSSDVSFLCNSEHEIVKAILSVDKIDPNKCREFCLSRYTPEIAAKKYLQCYENMIECGDVRSKNDNCEHQCSKTLKY